MKHSKHSKGFTLIELLITMGILGVIAAIAIPAYNGYIATSRELEGRNNLETMKAAQAEFFAENNRYFEGANSGALVTSSGGIWEPNETVDADRNFEYSVAAGSTGSITTSFLATATGRGGTYKVPASTVITEGN